MAEERAPKADKMELEVVVGREEATAIARAAAARETKAAETVRE